MINVNEYYNNTDKSKKSPGQWLNSKDVKNLVQEIDGKTDKNDDGEWFFDELLSQHYDLYLNPLKIKQEQSDKQPKSNEYDDLEDVYELTRNAFLEHITGKSVSILKKCVGDLDDIMSELPDNIKLQFKSFAYSFKVRYVDQRIKENRTMSYTLQSLINSIRFNVDTDKVLFANDKLTVKFRNTREK